MTGNILVDLGIALGGVLLLAALARAVFGTVSIAMTQSAAAERLAFEEPDFEPAAWLVDEKAGAAVARNDAGDIATIVAQGDRFVVRRLSRDAPGIHYTEGRLHIAPPDHTSRPVLVAVDPDKAGEWGA